MKILAVILGFIFSVIYLFDSIGFNFRGFGSKYSLPSLGYSLHIQISAASRTLLIFVMPAIGFMLDKGVELKTIVIIPIVCSLSYIIFFIVELKINFLSRYLENFFYLYVKKFRGGDLLEREYSENALSVLENKKILFSSGIAFFIISFGAFAVFLVAGIHPTYRATIIQSATLFTSLGTLISTFYFDPIVCKYIDIGYNQKSIIRSIYFGRLFAMLSTLSIMSFLAYSLYFL